MFNRRFVKCLVWLCALTVLFRVVQGTAWVWVVPALWLASSAFWLLHRQRAKRFRRSMQESRRSAGEEPVDDLAYFVILAILALLWPFPYAAGLEPENH